MWAMKEIF